MGASRLLALAIVLSFLNISACSEKDSSQKSRSQAVADEAALKQLTDQIAELQSRAERLKVSDKEKSELQIIIERLQKKLSEKRFAQSLSSENVRIMSEAMEGHTQTYPLYGKYEVMVIPVQFQDVKFDDPAFFEREAQDYLFGENKFSMTHYYRHSSLGRFNVSGVVTPSVTVDGTLEDYGKAIAGGKADQNPRELVVQALMKLREMKTDDAWWSQFDQWDLGDYDRDHHFNEPDGFIDSVVLVYAGKPQSSCQRSFDPDGTRPPSDEVEDGPRKDAAVECFNRLWPHRWAISLGKDDVRRSEMGPLVEGVERSSFNGLKINDHLFASDYNMQSEYSALSTFIHEFGHSISLPDIYATSGANSTGGWEVMSSTATLKAQEMSSWTRLSLGWLAPKIVKQGDDSSAYLGAINFVTHQERDRATGTLESREPGEVQDRLYDVLSFTPGFNEPVYRSIMAITDPSVESEKITDVSESTGMVQAYSGKFDAKSRSFKAKFSVPNEDSPKLTFDTIYHIETETNFDSRVEKIKVTTDFDLGKVFVDGELQEELRLISGDANYDGLAEMNNACEAERVLALRLKWMTDDGLTDEELAEFKEKKKICIDPVWVQKSYDLSKWKGKDVEFELRYTTDAGYTEFGIVFDNVKVGEKTLTFESNAERIIGDFELLKQGIAEKKYQQFYLFEYRDPIDEFLDRAGNELSYNMDNHIEFGTQAMFMEQGANPLDRFRLFTIDYQPGVLVWYYNSKFSRSENSPNTQAGKGYLLVLNSKVKELHLPGVLSQAGMFDENGNYDETKDTYKKVEERQRKLFVCFSHTRYATYITGENPDCAEDEYKDRMQLLTWKGNRLIYRREGFNDLLPQDRYDFEGVGEPLSSSPAIRTALSTFRPEGAPDFNPYRIFKHQDGKMVEDQELTDSAEKYPAVSSFSDGDNKLALNPRFHGDSVVVEKKGFSFQIFQPAEQVLQRYRQEVDANDAANFARRPRAKVQLKWGE